MFLVTERGIQKHLSKWLIHFLKSSQILVKFDILLIPADDQCIHMINKLFSVKVENVTKEGCDRLNYTKLGL